MKQHYMRQALFIIIAGMFMFTVTLPAAADTDQPMPTCSFKTVTTDLLNQPTIQTFTSAFIAEHKRAPHGGEKACWTRMFYWKKNQRNNN